MKKSELKQLIKEVVEEVHTENRIQKKKLLLKKADQLIAEMNEISKQEFGV